jgi:hypothetical protein
MKGVVSTWYVALLLTKFYMYLENIILQVTNTNTWNNSPKGAFWCWFAQRNKGDTHQLSANQAKHHRDLIQSLPHEDGGEVTRSGGGRPLGVPDPLSVLLSHPFDGEVACLHAKAVGAGPHTRNSLHHHLEPCIDRGVPIPLQDTILSIASHTSLNLVAFTF